MDSIPDDIVEGLLGHLSLQDVCSFQRVSHRCYDLAASDGVWKRLFEEYSLKPRGSGLADGWDSWKVRFHDSYCTQQRTEISRRRAELVALRSRLQELEWLMYKRKQQLHNEQRRLSELRPILHELRKQRAAACALEYQYWQPTIVREHHQQVLSSAPIERRWAINDVEQRISDSQLAMAGLRKSLQSGDLQHIQLSKRLEAMEGR